MQEQEKKGIHGFDTHIHSTASDGLLAPGALVQRAKEIGLQGMALTDHDTVAGLDEAIAAGQELDFPVIPGIELSAEHQDHDVHILGYWLDWHLLEDSGRLQQLAEARKWRIREIVRRLSLLGMELDAEAILVDAGTSPGRPHVAKAMVAAGYAGSVREAFTKWLSRGLPAYVSREKLSPFEAVDMIRACRGVAVVAHPGCGVPDQVLKALIRYGIGGIEAYHPDHSMALGRKYARLAAANGLAALGGSDFHLPGPRELGCRITMDGQLGKLAKFRQD